MAKQHAVGDKIRFWLGETPMLGTILFGVGQDGVAVRLSSGAEIIINIDTIK